MRADVRRSAARVLVDGVDAEVSRCAERARVERIASEMHVGEVQEDSSALPAIHA